MLRKCIALILPILVHWTPGSLADLPKWVHRVDSCPDPGNISQWLEESKKLNCYHNLMSNEPKEQEKVYHCLPSSFLNETVEFCGRNVPIESGKCTVYNYEVSQNVAPTSYKNNCSQFSSGCPEKQYFSKEVYNYPQCLQINRQGKCFEAESHCRSSTQFSVTGTETTPFDQSSRSGTETTPFDQREVSADEDSGSTSLPIGIGSSLVAVIIGVMICILYVRCTRKRFRESLNAHRHRSVTELEPLATNGNPPQAESYQQEDTRENGMEDDASQVQTTVDQIAMLIGHSLHGDLIKNLSEAMTDHQFNQIRDFLKEQPNSSQTKLDGISDKKEFVQYVVRKYSNVIVLQTMFMVCKANNLDKICQQYAKRRQYSKVEYIEEVGLLKELFTNVKYIIHCPNRSYTYGDIENLKRKVCELTKANRNEIAVIGVEEGSIIVTFMIKDSLIPTLRSLYIPKNLSKTLKRMSALKYEVMQVVIQDEVVYRSVLSTNQTRARDYTHLQSTSTPDSADSSTVSVSESAPPTPLPKNQNPMDPPIVEKDLENADPKSNDAPIFSDLTFQAEPASDWNSTKLSKRSAVKSEAGLSESPGKGDSNSVHFSHIDNIETPPYEETEQASVEPQPMFFPDVTHTPTPPPHLEGDLVKKSEAGKTAKIVKKLSASKSPNLTKKEPSPPDNAGLGTKPHSGSYSLMPAPDDQMVRSNEDLESVEVSSRENGSSGDGALDDIDGDVASGTDVQDPQKTKAAIEHYERKLNKTMELIKAEHTAKEENVNEYLRLAAGASEDKQQLARIKTVFEKKNQKSTQSISTLQKKLEGYAKRIEEIQTSGVTSHKKAKEVLSDMGHGLKGVVGNIKGAKDTMMAKPKEFAHLIKNKFGSADNINQIKSLDEGGRPEGDKQHGGTLPARYPFGFKYTDEDDNSSILSGSNYDIQSSPLSNSQNTSQQFPGLTQAALEPILTEIEHVKESNRTLSETVTRLTEELEQCKRWYSTELTGLRQVLEDERFKYERLEEQMNDMTELNQNEFSNLRQDISSMEEKIEYRLDERTTDLQDNVENCQTRITKMELQQQQQQIISMEMVENVTFRTLLTKLINVVLAIVAVVLVIVSTAANLVAPFLTTRARILSSAVLVVAVIVVVRNWDGLIHCLDSIWQYVYEAQPFR